LKFLVSHADGFDGPFTAARRGAQPAVATLSSLPRWSDEEGDPADLRQHKSAPGKLCVANLRPRGLSDESRYVPSPADSAVSRWLPTPWWCRQLSYISSEPWSPAAAASLRICPRIARHAAQRGLRCKPVSDFEGYLSRKCRAGRGHHGPTGDPSSRSERQDQEP
jgi:hypothetical protein